MYSCLYYKQLYLYKHTIRKAFEPQLVLGCTPIEEVKTPLKTKNHVVALVTALQYIYVNPHWNEKIFKLLSQHLIKGNNKMGRTGMSLWEIFVLAQVRLCMNISYDQLHHTANYDTLVRGVLGVLPNDYTLGQQYEYQHIYDNVSLLTNELLVELNNIIVEVGHEVFKKKGKTAKEATVSPLEKVQCKTDSFVVESDTHFPTDYNLLWDSARKCIDVASWLSQKDYCEGWRKASDWRKCLKGLMRMVGKTTSGGGKNKEDRVIYVTTAYLTKARALMTKSKLILASHSVGSNPVAISKVLELTYYVEMLDKHIDLLDRRVLKAERIPHEEKVFSIFQPYAEFIKKGKLHPNVEIGKKLAITTDQHHLILDWQIAENQADSQLIVPIAERLKTKYEVMSLSTDKGFSSQSDKEHLKTFIPEVIMQKKGRLSKEDKAIESAPAFKRLNHKHSAIESNINELEHRGLNRVPNRTRRTFDAYIGLAITAYNLHKIGRKLQALRLETLKKEEDKLKRAA